MYALLLALGVAPADAAFTVVGATEERPAAQLVRLSADFTATVATRTGDTAIKDVVSLRRAGRPLPPFPTGPHLLTAGGDRVAGTLVGGGRDTLRFAPSVAGADAEAWVVPLPAVAAVWLADTPADTPPDVGRYTWAAGGKNRDVLRLRTGDTPTGTLVGVVGENDRPTFRFRPVGAEAGSDPLELAGTDVSAVVFNPTLARNRRPKGPFARVVLTDGSRLGLVNATAADGKLRGETLFGQKVELPLAALVSLDVLQGKAAYLSDLKPKKAEVAGFLGAGWPWAADRTVSGEALRLAGGGGDSTFDKGLGTHPRTVLTYDLGGKYRRFEALVAGKSVPVKFDVSGAKELVLEVDFGPTAGVRAAVNWADARLVE